MGKSVYDCQTPDELSEAIAYILNQGGMRREIYSEGVFIRTEYDDYETRRYYGIALNKYNEIRKSNPKMPRPQIGTSDTLSALAQLYQLCTASNGKAVDESEVTEQKTLPAKCWRLWTCIKKIPRWIYVLVIFFAALLTCLFYLEWLEPIKAFLYRIMLRK